MRIESFDWDEVNIEHIARHRVTPDEAEEVFESNHYILRSRSGRYLILGKTAAGRYLVCIAEVGIQGSARVITAMDMREAQRKLYRRKVR